MSLRQLFRSQPLLGVWWGVAVALTSACSNTTDRTASMADERPVATSGATIPTSETKSIELSGCLQKSNGSYIVTETGRRTVNGAPREFRLRVAEKKGKLDALVGKQVRVSGILVGHLDPTLDDDRRANDLIVGTAGARDADHESPLNSARVASGEPSRVDVASIHQLAERCGTR